MIQFSRPPIPLVQQRSKFFDSLELWRPISNEPPSPNDNQSIKRKHNPSEVIRSFLQVGFCFQNKLIDLVWLFVGFFPFRWSQTRTQNNSKKSKTSFSSSSYSEKMCWVNVELNPYYLLFRNFIFLCVQLSKSITKCFLFIIIPIFNTLFGINLIYLHHLKTQTNYGTTTASCM